MDIERIGEYKIEAEIGRGTMGRVYKAHHPRLNRFVAIKTVSAVSGLGDEKHQRFQREAQASALLSHPNIVTVHDFGEEHGLIYMVMELLEGTDLREAIDRDLLKNIDDKLAVMEQICSGLAFAHSKGVIHRDLKPANIHIQQNGQVKIVDFGLAHVKDSDMTQEGIVLGTPNYMSPEQALGDRVDARSDIFSAGAIFYEILTNHKPFDADSTPGVLYQVVHKEAAAIRQWTPEVPRVLVDVVEKALVKDKTRRFQTARQMRTALSVARRALEGGRGPDASLAEEHQRELRAAGNRTDPVFRSSGLGSGSHPGYVEGTVALDMSPVSKAREGSRPGPPTLSGSAPTQVPTPTPRGRSGRVRPVRRGPAPALLAGVGAVVLLGLAGAAYQVWMPKPAPPSPPPASAPPSSEVSALTHALVETQLQLAVRDLEDKNYGAAIAQAERVLKLAPGSPEARNLMEQAQQRTRELESAVAQARQALEAGNTGAASQALSHVLELDPRHPAAEELSARLNTAFRSRAEEAARSMRQARGDAERAKAMTGEPYAEAASLAKEGEALFARSEFASATRAFLEARDGFDRARRAVRAPVAPATAPQVASASANLATAPPVSVPAPAASAPEPPAPALASRHFVTGKTAIASRRARGDLAGFDTADVKKQQMPDFVGRIEFETVPAVPTPGETFTVKVHLVNEGKKPLRLKAVNLVMTMNGRKTPSAPVPLVREVAPTQRAVVAELQGVWEAGVASWNLEAVVTSDRDETGTSRLSWN